jgi:uncharacterized protein YuzE
MRWTFDANADAFYLYLSDAAPASQEDLGEGLIADIDQDGALVGIEVLGSNRALPSDGLERLGVSEAAFGMLAALVAQPFPVAGRHRPDVSTDQVASPFSLVRA